MAQTFTGLKLKGELGRFGKTEICDVLGVYPMPDEKVSRRQSCNVMYVVVLMQCYLYCSGLAGVIWL